MFGLSGEHLIVLTLVLFFFGPRVLPGVGKTLGKAARNFKDSFRGTIEPEFRRLDEKPIREPHDQ